MLIENAPYAHDGRVRREATALRMAGYSVRVICPRAPGEPLLTVHDGVSAYQYPPWPGGRGAIAYLCEYTYALVLTTWWTIWIWLNHGIDVIHAHNPPDLFVLLALCWRPLGVRFVFDHHDLAPEMFACRFRSSATSRLYRALLYFENLSYRVADHVMAANESYRQLAGTRAGVSMNKITVVRNGPEPFHFAPVPPHESLAEESRHVLGFVGEMGPLDGLDDLLAALRHLKFGLHRHDWVCILVGDGDVRRALQSQAEDLGLADHLRFIGRVPQREVTRYLAAMEICLVPDPKNEYTDRGTLIKVAEYMAQGRPMVAFSLTETAWAAGQAAIYATANDPRVFAECIQLLMDDPQRRATMGEFGRERARRILAWEHSKDALCAAYRQVLRPTTVHPIG